jgi:hypothetical protein
MRKITELLDEMEHLNRAAQWLKGRDFEVAAMHAGMVMAAINGNYIGEASEGGKRRFPN